jgi:hypothetical protein
MGRGEPGVSNSALDIDVDALDRREVPHPQHSWATAKRCIQEACDANEHDWVELTDSTGKTFHWRECRVCGIADVTAKAVRQNVKTPNTKERKS